jgi:hypothetical protein
MEYIWAPPSVTIFVRSHDHYDGQWWPTDRSDEGTDWSSTDEETDDEDDGSKDDRYVRHEQDRSMNRSLTARTKENISQSYTTCCNIWNKIIRTSCRIFIDTALEEIMQSTTWWKIWTFFGKILTTRMSSVNKWAKKLRNWSSSSKVDNELLRNITTRGKILTGEAITHRWNRPTGQKKIIQIFFDEFKKNWVLGTEAPSCSTGGHSPW